MSLVKPQSWSTAVPDWEDRILSGRSLLPTLPLFEAEAERGLRVFKRLRVPDLIGKPPMAEAGADWFFAIVAAVFGSYDPILNVRHVTEVFVLVPKKNGKSSYSGALLIATLIVNRRPGAELLLIAPTKTIADIAFRQAALTIKADPALVALFHVQGHIRRITHRQTDAVAYIKAADTDAITGGKNTYAIIDETHEFAKKPRANQVFVEVRGALAARPDGFLMQLTTQSKEPPAGVFKDELEIARQVRDGKLALPLLPVLYELPDRIAADGGWKTRRFWPLVNPNYGRSVRPEFLEDELTKAEVKGIEALALLASQHFNVQIGLSLRADRWPGADYWLQAADPTLTLATLIERSEVICIGIDGGGLDDLLGITVVGREKGGRRWLSWSKAFARIVALRRRKSVAAELIDFAKSGDLVAVDSSGPVEPSRIAALIEALEPEPEQESLVIPEGEEPATPPDIAELVKVVVEVEASGLLAQVGLDPVGIGMIVDALAEIGIGGEPEGEPSRVVGVSQGFKLMGAIHAVGRKLEDGTLVHADQALMAFCVGNAKCEVKGNALMITKQLAGAAKIDPLMALFDAAALMATNPEPAGSIYTAERGLAVFG